MTHPDRVLAALTTIAETTPDLLRGPASPAPEPARIVSFRWDGTPVPKGRPRLGKGGNTYTPKRTRAYEDAIGWAWKETGERPFEGDVSMSIDIFEAPGHPADLDNHVKAILDALQGLAFANDRQVTVLFAEIMRASAEPGIVLIVEAA